MAVLSPLTVPIKNRKLLGSLVAREIRARYRGSMLGLSWLIITPLFLLAIYTIVFGKVFGAKWPEDSAIDAPFALIVFSGLVIFNFVSLVFNRSPTLLMENSNLVTRVRFPLELLPVAAAGAALVDLTVGLALLLIGTVLTIGVSWTAILVPLAVAPVLVAAAAGSTLLAAFGVYFRDLREIVAVSITALLFLSPVFFPLESLPDSIRLVSRANPVVIPLQSLRIVLFAGAMPSWIEWAAYLVGSVVSLLLAGIVFRVLRPGFADVL